MNLSDSISFHNQMRALKIIFYALLAGQVIFFLVAFIIKDVFSPNQEMTKVFDYMVPVFLFGGIFLSRYLYRMMISKSRDLPLPNKMMNYRTAVVISLAVLEAANMIAITAFMITGEYLYAAASVILFLLFMLSAPGEDKLRTDMEMSTEEISEIK